MKLKTSTIKTAGAMMLTMMLTASVPSRQSEADRKGEGLREEMRNAIGIIEKAQQDHLVVQREFVELHEKLNEKAYVLGTRRPAETERENPEHSEQEYANRWQDDIREKIDNASGEELQRVSMELRRNGKKADVGKTFTASARESR